MPVSLLGTPPQCIQILRYIHSSAVNNVVCCKSSTLFTSTAGNWTASMVPEVLAAYNTALTMVRLGPIILMSAELRKLTHHFQGIHHNSRLPQFVLGLEGYIRLTLSFVFNSRPPTPDITSRGSPRPMRIIATIIQVYPLNTESESQANSGYDDCAIFAYLRRQLEELCTLRSVVLSFPDHKTLQRVTNYVASLRDPWRNVTCVYRFVCQDDMQDPLPVNPYRPHFNSSSGGIRYDHSYEIIPATLELTGTVYFETIMLLRF